MYPYFALGQGCQSPVGRGGGPNYISLGPGCWYTHTAAHEVMHSLGFWHEQMRPDRDQAVEIQWGNISPSMKYNFGKLAPEKWDSFGSPYDILSVMQYPGDAFSQNGQPTIIDKRTGRSVPWNKAVSQSDYEQINLLYRCSNTGERPLTTQSPHTRTR